VADDSPDRRDDDALDEPRRRDVALLAYRDAHGDPQWLELTPTAAAIVDRLLTGEPLGNAVESACAASGAGPTALREVVALLADLAARGIVIGAAVP
jgi:hypothetical protein